MPLICRELRNEMTAKWQQFINRLGLEQKDIEIIRVNNPGNCSLCLQHALHSWLSLNYKYEKHGRPSWRKIAEALKDLDSMTLFIEIAKTHGKLKIMSSLVQIVFIKMQWQNFCIEGNKSSYGNCVDS